MLKKNNNKTLISAFPIKFFVRTISQLYPSLTHPVFNYDDISNDEHNQNNHS